MKKSLNLSKHILHTAIVTVLLTSTQTAFAGSCIETQTSQFTCFGAASLTGEDTEIKITDSTNPVTLTTESGFGIDTTQTYSKPAVTITTTKGIELIDNNQSTFTSNNKTISVTNLESGNIVITTNGTIKGLESPLSVINKAINGDIDITVNNVIANGPPSTGHDVISVLNQSKTGHLNITTLGNIAGETGEVSIIHDGSGKVTVTNSGILSAVGKNKYNSVSVNSLKSPIEIINNKTIQGLTINSRILGSTTNKYTIPSASPTTITNNGDIISSGDIPIISRNITKIQNTGRIMGVVALSSEDDVFNNGSIPIKYGTNPSTYGDNFDLRRFIKITEGFRTRQETAISDFLDGNDTFNNNKTGFLRLATIPDVNNSFTPSANDDFAPTSTNGTYSISGTNISLDVSVTGVEHAQLINLENFNNAGTITMADTETGGSEAVSGDILVITSRGTSLTGTPSGTFTSNGGELHIDTLLSDGANGSSDVLVIDKSVLGTGPTKVTVHNANGTGADTGAGNSNGILVIRVLGDSDANAFVLANLVEAGNHQYSLVQADGKNWYLQSSLKNNSTMTLSAAKVTGTVGNTVMLPIQFGSNDAVVGMQFDATFNSSVLSVESLLNGADIGGAMVSSSAIGANTYRVIIADLNKNNINNGELVKLNFKINAQAGNGTYPIDINNIKVTDTNAATLTFDAANIQAGSIKIAGVNSTVTLDIPNISGFLGQTIKLPISLANNDNVVGMQFDVIFDGNVFTAVNHVNGVDLGAATINANSINANTYRFVITDLNLNNLNNGVLANLNLKINGNATPNDYNITLTNADFANTSGGTVTAANIGSAVIKISSSIVGDSNGDNQVNVNDIISLINLILTSGTAQNGSDCNNDGNINVNDIICTINIILTK